MDERPGDKPSEENWQRVVRLLRDERCVGRHDLMADAASMIERLVGYLDNATSAPQKSSESPTPERRIDNLRRIAADDSVNAFARSICMEAADRIGDLERELAAVKGVAYNAEKCVCRMDEGGTVISLCGAHQAHFDAAQSAIAPLEKEKP